MVSVGGPRRTDIESEDGTGGFVCRVDLSSGMRWNWGPTLPEGRLLRLSSTLSLKSNVRSRD